ncbi:cytochrome P450 [Mycobacterium sp. MUNTM1]
MHTPQIDDQLDFTSDAFLRNPWPTYRLLRRTAPVSWSERSSAFFVSKHEDVTAALAGKQFVSGFPLRASRRLFGRTGVDSDGPDHREFRKLFAPIFGPGAVRRLQSEILVPAVDDALHEASSFLGARTWPSADVIDCLAVRVPYGVITRLMGCPVDDAAWLRSHIVPLSGAIEFPSASLEAALIAKSELTAYLGRLISDRGRADGPLSILDVAVPRDSPADLAQVGRAILFFAAGTETSVTAIRHIFRALHEHDVDLGSLVDDALRRRVIRETLRWDPPSHTVVRYAATDLSLRGVQIPRRSAVLLSLASANRDDEVYADPDVWWPNRTESRTLSFSAGSHSCIGMALALAEFDLLFQRLARLFLRA